LAWRGFHPESAAFWDRIDLGSVHSSCGVAFKSGHRIIVPDVEDCEFMAGSADLDHSRLSAVRAVQSTPLISRSGDLLGMISTHWREPHHPPERSLRLFDVLARQGADLIERTRAESQIVMLAREAEHRAKNLLATVQATVQLSHSDTPKGLKESIVGRINALRNVHRLFVESRWSGADLRTIALEELSPYRLEAEAQAQIDGASVMLKADVAQAIAVVLHELATNAAKYGALSVAGGRVHVTWAEVPDERLILRWTETGGPPARPPTGEGFGTRVMRSMLISLRGDMRFDWSENGLLCEIAIPI
jgi:two-component sensor histidine kinase